MTEQERRAREDAHFAGPEWQALGQKVRTMRDLIKRSVCENEASILDDLDAALAAERRATVERALQVLDAHNWGDNLSRSHPDWRDSESAARHIRRHLATEASHDSR